jgi:hypothetical protein
MASLEAGKTHDRHSRTFTEDKATSVRQKREIRQIRFQSLRIIDFSV